MSVYQRPLRPDELMHYGVKGQRWGQRRYQNEDGSYTAAGRTHYGRGLGDRMRQGYAGMMRRDAAKSMSKARNYKQGSLRRKFYEANANIALKDARNVENKQRKVNFNRSERKRVRGNIKKYYTNTNFRNKVDDDYRKNYYGSKKFKAALGASLGGAAASTAAYALAKKGKTKAARAALGIGAGLTTAGMGLGYANTIAAQRKTRSKYGMMKRKYKR